MSEEMKEIHKLADLSGLKRKSHDKILATILEQSTRERGRQTTEEYLTRYITEVKKHILNDAEPVLFDQYPLYKRPAKSQQIDIIYAYSINQQWRIGLIEAKNAGGDDYLKSIQQAVNYAQELQNLLPERQSLFNERLKQVHSAEITLNDGFLVSRIDILAPLSWWRKHQLQLQELNIQDIANQFEIRHLACNDEFLNPEKMVQKLDISIYSL